MFAIFASTSFLSDTANTVGRPNPRSGNPMARLVYPQVGWLRSCADRQPALRASHRRVRIGAAFGVFYFVLIYAFVRGREWIRLPVIFYAGMIVMGTGLYLAVGALGDAPLFALACGPGSELRRQVAQRAD